VLNRAVIDGYHRHMRSSVSALSVGPSDHRQSKRDHEFVIIDTAFILGTVGKIIIYLLLLCLSHMYTAH